MSGRYDIIKDFLDALSVYEDTAGPGADINYRGFIDHELEKRSTESPLERRNVAGQVDKEKLGRGNKKDESIAILVAYLYRYAKLYVKQALEGSPLQTIDDFSYLIVLLTHDSLSKTELINKNAHEKTTGMEIIKRQIRLGLMEQRDDEHDKRSQRVMITPAGRGVIFAVLDKMAQVSAVMAGPLNNDEKNILLHLLAKLDHFHFDLFSNERHTPLEQIISEKIGG